MTFSWILPRLDTSDRTQARWDGEALTILKGTGDCRNLSLRSPSCSSRRLGFSSVILPQFTWPRQYTSCNDRNFFFSFLFLPQESSWTKGSNHLKTGTNSRRASFRRAISIHPFTPVDTDVIISLFVNARVSANVTLLYPLLLFVTIICCHSFVAINLFPLLLQFLNILFAFNRLVSLFSSIAENTGRWHWWAPSVNGHGSNPGKKIPPSVADWPS